MILPPALQEYEDSKITSPWDDYAMRCKDGGVALLYKGKEIGWWKDVGNETPEKEPDRQGMETAAQYTPGQGTGKESAE